MPRQGWSLCTAPCAKSRNVTSYHAASQPSGTTGCIDIRPCHKTTMAYLLQTLHHAPPAHDTRLHLVHVQWVHVPIMQRLACKAKEGKHIEGCSHSRGVQNKTALMKLARKVPALATCSCWQLLQVGSRWNQAAFQVCNLFHPVPVRPAYSAVWEAKPRQLSGASTVRCLSQLIRFS